MRLSSPPKPQAPRGPASRARLDAGGEGERAPKAPRHILPASSAASQAATSGSIYTRGTAEVTPCRAQLRPPCTAAARPDSRPPPAPAAPQDRTRRPAGPAGPGSASRPARQGGPRGAAGPQAWAAARPYHPRARPARGPRRAHLLSRACRTFPGCAGGRGRRSWGPGPAAAGPQAGAAAARLGPGSQRLRPAPAWRAPRAAACALGQRRSRPPRAAAPAASRRRSASSAAAAAAAASPGPVSRPQRRATAAAAAAARLGRLGRGQSATCRAPATPPRAQRPLPARSRP